MYLVFVTMKLRLGYLAIVVGVANADVEIGRPVGGSPCAVVSASASAQLAIAPRGE